MCVTMVAICSVRSPSCTPLPPFRMSSQSDIPEGSTCQKANDAAPVLTPIPTVCSLVWSIVYQGNARSACNGRHSRSP